MKSIAAALENALRDAVIAIGVPHPSIILQEVPEGKPGDFGSPVAFTLARELRRPPAQIAADIIANFTAPAGITHAEAVGPYINFTVDPAMYVQAVTEHHITAVPNPLKVVVEHTSVNPNKEAHVGHLRNIVLGDAVARILTAVGHNVEIHNYIDDTGRQAAESIFAIDYFNATYDGSKKYDHWLGELYVQLGEAKASDAETIEAGVSEVMHQLERGELRERVTEVLSAQLETFHSLGAEYDLLVWESDVVHAGFLEQGLAVLQDSPYVSRPTSGKFAGALVMDVSEFIPGLEETNVVLVRKDGNAMYVAKDIGYQFWKAGLFSGMPITRFTEQPSGRVLYTTNPSGENTVDGREFAHAQEIINVIDVRQSHPQLIVKTALALSNTTEGQTAYNNSHHLAYEVVTLEGQAMSGRKGITLSIDEALAEAKRRALAVVQENAQPSNPTEVADAVGLGALRFSMVKSEARKIIDFRWEQALSLQGDSAPYVQYAHARASSILRQAAEQNIDMANADFSQLGTLEVKLAQVLDRFNRTVHQAAETLAPNLIAQYLLDVAAAFNSYYNHRGPDGKPDTQVLRAAPGLREARLALVAAVQRTTRDGLALLGIAAPEVM